MTELIKPTICDLIREAGYVSSNLVFSVRSTLTHQTVNWKHVHLQVLFHSGISSVDSNEILHKILLPTRECQTLSGKEFN